jgi:hypothetical protein
LETPGALVLGYNRKFHQEVKKINEKVDVRDLLNKNKEQAMFKSYMPGVMNDELR